MTLMMTLDDLMTQYEISPTALKQDMYSVHMPPHSSDWSKGNFLNLSGWPIRSQLVYPRKVYMKYVWSMVCEMLPSALLTLSSHVLSCGIKLTDESNYSCPNIYQPLVPLTQYTEAVYSYFSYSFTSLSILCTISLLHYTFTSITNV